MKGLYLLLCLLQMAVALGQRGGAVAEQADSIRTNYALVVGISYYASIPHLLYANDDADLFANYLVQEQICDRKNVVKLTDSMATQARFYKELKHLMDQTTSGDRVFIYFAGHGDVENDIESGFVLC